MISFTVLVLSLSEYMNIEIFYAIRYSLAIQKGYIYIIISMYKCYVFCAVNFHKYNIAVVWIKLDKYDIS